MTSRTFLKPLMCPIPILALEELRRAIAQELAVDTQAIAGEHQLARALQQRLLEINQTGSRSFCSLMKRKRYRKKAWKRCGYCQTWKRSHANCYTSCWSGSRSLDDRLQQHRFRQLRQRISFSYRLTAMNADETREYIGHRMRIAGYSGAPIFSAKVVASVYECSRGIPRLVNMLCHKMLLLAFGEGRHQLTLNDIKLAAADTDDVVYRSRRYRCCYGLFIDSRCWCCANGALFVDYATTGVTAVEYY